MTAPVLTSKLDLESGEATEAGEISGLEGELTDITVLPAM